VHGDPEEAGQGCQDLTRRRDVLSLPRHSRLQPEVGAAGDDQAVGIAESTPSKPPTPVASTVSPASSSVSVAAPELSSALTARVAGWPAPSVKL
jgi:hypothetical protein